MESLQKGVTLQDRYDILDVIGRGGSGITYRAKDIVSGGLVALKALSLKGLSDWKKLELFEREAQVLAELDHPAIPNYLDYFQIDTVDDRSFYIVQELAEGTTLAALVSAGKRFSETDARRIALEILQVLQYLHGLNPPIIHRDIKPQNIIRHTDGRIFLVDFGAVQAVYRDTVAFGSTVVGTYGYMAPEQFRGQSEPATDLYGLGATLLHLLTHKHPGDLPQKRLKYDFRNYVSVSDEFSHWLEGLLEPVVEDRFDSASTALSTLNSPASPQTRYAVSKPTNTTVSLPKLADSKVQLYRSQTNLYLNAVPSNAFAIKQSHWSAIDIRDINITTILFITIITVSLLIILVSKPFTLGILGLPLCLIAAFLWEYHVHLTSPVLLDIEGDHFTFTRQLPNRSAVHQGQTAHLRGAYLTGRSDLVSQSNHNTSKAIVLAEGNREHEFGVFLSNFEKEWIVSEINTFLKERKRS